MDAERNAEEPDQIRSPNGEWFPADAKLNLLCVRRVSAVLSGYPYCIEAG